MLWQVAADLRFRMPEGYIIGRHTSVLHAAYRGLFDRMARLGRGEFVGAPAQSERHELRCTLVDLGVQTVVVGPMAAGRPQTVALFQDLLGDPPIGTAGVDYWPDALVAARRGAGRCT
jgi:hypothetical protein